MGPYLQEPLRHKDWHMSEHGAVLYNVNRAGGYPKYLLLADGTQGSNTRSRRYWKVGNETGTHSGTLLVSVECRPGADEATLQPDNVAQVKENPTKNRRLSQRH